MTKPCVGCGAVLPVEDGPVHAYMESSPACWRRYGAVLAREYSDPECWKVHRLTVDAFAVQHPGRPSRRAVQSVCGHLVSLCLVFEGGGTLEAGPEVMRLAMSRRHLFHWLDPPALMGLTAADVAAADTPAEHVALVRDWAQSAWDAWAAHHATVRAWIAGR